MSLNKECALKYLRDAIGRDDAQFKAGQWKSISTLVNDRKRSLVIQSTGWGKSMVYFTSTKLLREQGCGPTIVISPLLALMRNQVESAQKLNLNAVTLNSTNTNHHETIKNKIRKNEIDILLLSPEKLNSTTFTEEYLSLIANKVGLVVIDEAHCISDWGHDFRPDYKRISRVLSRLPKGIPVLATTATANKRVETDILEQLGECTQISRGPLARPSLSLDTVRIDDPAARLAWLTKKIRSLNCSGIVYVLTQRDAERVADWLVQEGVQAKPYHGGLKQEREELETALINNEIKCLVATSALGMGFDKPDLGFVIHYQAPNSVVHYYQQVGRAGRGISKAYGILLYGEEDDQIHHFFRTSAFPPKCQILTILKYIEESKNGLSDNELKLSLNVQDRHLKRILEYLSVQDPAPIIKRNSRWLRTPHEFAFNKELIEHLTRIRESEWEDILEYGKKQKCLMQFLGEKLDDPHAKTCGKCSVCLNKPSTENDYDKETYKAALIYLGCSENKIEPRKQFSNPMLGKEFGALNSKIPKNQQAGTGYCLSRYGEPVIGKLVKEGKIGGRFNQELVTASARMIQSRWTDAKSIEWVTCIPSKRHPKLVADFAERLAIALKLPFHPALEKVQDRRPQKKMENSHFQCSNLLGAFEANIPDDFKGKDVLLIDDIVDSRWTLTIAAYLLRKQGAGLVFPFALASSAPGD